MKLAKLSRLFVFVLLVLGATAFANGLDVHAAAADPGICDQAPANHSGTYANLDVVFKKSDGTVFHPAFYLSTGCNSGTHQPYGITTTPGGPPLVQRVDIPAGGNGDFSLAYHGGNGHQLNCTQSAPDGSESHILAQAFHVVVTDNNYQNGQNGTWSKSLGDWFEVANGGHKTVTYVWTPFPPTATIKGDKFDTNGNKLPNSDDNELVTYEGQNSRQSPFEWDNVNPGNNKNFSAQDGARYVVTDVKWRDVTNDNQNNNGNPNWHDPGTVSHITFNVQGGDTYYIYVEYKDTYSDVSGDKYDMSGNLLDNADDNELVTLGAQSTHASPYDFPGFPPRDNVVFSCGNGASYILDHFKWRDRTADANQGNGPNWHITNPNSNNAFQIDIKPGHDYTIQCWYQQLADVSGDKYDMHGNLLPNTDDNELISLGSRSTRNSPYDFQNETPRNNATFTAGDGTRYKLDHFKWRDKTADTNQGNGPNWHITNPDSNNSFQIDLKQGHFYVVQSWYALQTSDDSACANPTSTNITTVAPNTNFNYNVAFTNTGSTKWYSTSYHIQTTFVSPGGRVRQWTFQPLTVSNGGTASLDTANVPSNPAQLKSPSAIGTYTLAVTMVDDQNSAFGAECDYTINVANPFNYVPRISSSAGGSASLPASSAPVHPGDVITLRLSIYNIDTTNGNIGSNFDYNVDYYEGPLDTNTSSVTFGPNVQIGNATNQPGIKSNNNVDETVNYTVPSSAADGTEICFFGHVTPAKYNIVNRYTNFNAPFPGSDRGANIRSAYSNGNVVDNDLCVEVQITRNPEAQALQGDVHAGGNIGNGSCVEPPATKGKITGNGGQSFAEYVTSAYNTISGFGSGNGGGSPLTLSNLDAAGGTYGYICRPDLAAVAANYPNSVPAPLTNGKIDISQLTGNHLYTHTGNVTVTGGTVAPGTRATLYVNGTVTINGNISLATGATNLASIPSFGLITGNGGNIRISGNVTQLDGFYVASNTDDTNGYIDTCYQHDLNGPTQPSHLTGDCPNVLQILGSLTGHNIYFWRTGADGTFLGQGVVTERDRQSGILFLNPPPAFETQSNTPYARPSYDGEYAPLY